MSRLRFTPVLIMAATAGFFAPSLVAQPGTGRIKAMIGDEGGKPVSQAVVIYHRIPNGNRDAAGRFQESPGQTPLTAQVNVDVTGALATPQLPSGNYILCIKAAGYLTSCNWSGWHTATVSAGLDHDFARIVLKKAAPVTIRINDPLHLLPKDPNSLGLSVGVLDEDRNLHGPDQSATDSSGRTLQVGVPLGRAMQLWVHGGIFNLTGGDGLPLNAAGTKIPFRANEGGLLPSFVVNVIGKR